MLEGNAVYYLWIIAYLFTAAVLCALILPYVIRLLKESGAEVANYRQHNVVNMGGIVIVIVWLMLMALALLLSVIMDSVVVPVSGDYIVGAKIALPLSLLIIGSSLFGLIDDSIGTREFSGFKGHIGALLKGRLTTGALKALGIPVIAIIVLSLYSDGALELLINALLISLVVNSFNLFDLRPGRALKVYIPLQLIVMVFVEAELATTSAAMLGIAIVLIGPDLKERIMLGDTGSNALGAALGFYIAVGFGWNIKLPVILLLILLQMVTESVSISSVIEKTTFLRKLDNYGREKEPRKGL